MTYEVWKPETDVVVSPHAGRTNVTMLPNGGYVTAWHHLNDKRVYIQLFTGEGTKIGGQVAIATSGEPGSINVLAINAAGDFAVSWSEYSGGTNGWSFKTQVFDINGVAKESAVTIKDGLNLDAFEVAAMAQHGNGGYVVAYSVNNEAGSERGIRFSVHDADGTKVQDLPPIITAVNAENPEVTRVGANKYVVTYKVSDSVIQAKIVDVAAGTVTNLATPDVGQVSYTGYSDVVPWSAPGNPDGFAIFYNRGSSELVAKVYSANGTATGQEYVIASGLQENRKPQDVVLLRDGRIAVVYTQIQADGDNGDIYLKIVSPSGVAGDPNNPVVSNHLLVNTGSAPTDGRQMQMRPTITEMQDGRLAITWDDTGAGKVVTNIVDVRIAAVTVNGTQGNDVYAGTDYDGNQLNGYAGNDKFFAGKGTDTFNGGDGIDTVTYERSKGAVTVNLVTGGLNADARGDAYNSIEKLIGSAHSDHLTGDTANNTIEGGAGNDTLSGGGGADVLIGGSGSDTYFADSNTRVVEAVGGGYDTVYATSSFTLQEGSEVEALLAYGVGNFALTGNSFDNSITGNENDNRLDGGGGNDYLYGNGGNDHLYGGAGFDFLYGGTGNDHLEGGDGDDVLDGQTGADVMLGGSGNDTYYVDDAGDQVIDNAGGGTDTVYSSVSFALNAASEIEALIAGSNTGLTLTGNGFANSITGNAGADVLYGQDGNDRLSGGSGNDKLWGGKGKDTLTGGSGKDIFVFDAKPNKKTNLDKITDFKVKDDSIWLENKVFTKLGKKGTEKKPAALKKDFFTIGSKAKDKNDYIVYDNKKGVLYYDADGSGRGKAVEIATLSKNLKMTYKDFFVI